MVTYYVYFHYRDPELLLYDLAPDLDAYWPLKKLPYVIRVWVKEKLPC